MEPIARRYLLSFWAMTAALGCLVATPADAEFVSIVWEEDRLALDGVTPLMDLAGYGGETVINIYARFDDPQDQCVGVVGTPKTPLNFAFGTPDSLQGPVNQRLFGQDVPVSAPLASAFPDLNWDSFFTIGTKFSNEQTTEIVLQPGTPGPNTNPWQGDSFDSGWSIAAEVDGKPTPESLAGPDLRVLLMRIALPQGSGGLLLMGMGVTVLDPEPRTIFVQQFDSLCQATSGPDCNFNYIRDECDIILDWSEDCNGNGVPDECESANDNAPGACQCVADMARPTDGVVDVSDLTLLILNWGQPGGPADLNVDGIVDVGDLVLLITLWGSC